MSELEPQTPSPGRKFHVESDLQVKNKQLQRPEAKIRKIDPRIFETYFFNFSILFGRWEASAAI